MRQLITNTGFGTGVDWRPNPGIGFPGYVNYLPVTRAVPEPPSIRNLFGGPAIGTDSVSGCPGLRRADVRAGRHPVVAGTAAGTSAGGAAGSGSDAGIGAVRGAGARIPTTDSVAAGSAPALRRARAVIRDRPHPTRRPERKPAMTANWKSAAVRLGIFLAVCLLGVFALYAVFGQLRFGEKTNTYKAEFINVTGLENGDFVRIAGVEVGQGQEDLHPAGYHCARRVHRRRLGRAHRRQSGGHPLRRSHRRPLPVTGGGRRWYHEGQAG